MPSPVQAHSKAFWRDSALGAAIDTPVVAYIITDSPDRVFSMTRPETAAFVNDGTGTYVLTDGPIAPDADRLTAVLVNGEIRVY